MPLSQRELHRQLRADLRRAKITERTRNVIDQDRLEDLAATTGWRPPGITAGTLPGRDGGPMVGKGGRDASR